MIVQVRCKNDNSHYILSDEDEAIDHEKCYDCGNDTEVIKKEDITDPIVLIDIIADTLECYNYHRMTSMPEEIYKEIIEKYIEVKYHADVLRVLESIIIPD